MNRTFVVLALALHLMSIPAFTQDTVTRYVRYTTGNRTFYGILNGDTITELRGNVFERERPTGRTFKISDVKLEAPVQPSKIIAVGRNYKSHIGDQPPTQYPGLFWKPPTSIVGPGDNIVLPEGADNAHYEAELVVVIGKQAKNITRAEAHEYIFGVTAGNDVSERDWQRNDLQWFRAKGTDTFGPLGPMLVRGLDYNNLLVQSRLNGEVKQSQRTSDLLFDIDTIVSYVSQFVTLNPGDVIYTGTPGQTSAMKPGDIIEVEVEGVGILRNRVTSRMAITVEMHR